MLLADERRECLKANGNILRVVSLAASWTSLLLKCSASKALWIVFLDFAWESCLVLGDTGIKMNTASVVLLFAKSAVFEAPARIYPQPALKFAESFVMPRLSSMGLKSWSKGQPKVDHQNILQTSYLACQHQEFSF